MMIAGNQWLGGLPCSEAQSQSGHKYGKFNGSLFHNPIEKKYFTNVQSDGWGIR